MQQAAPQTFDRVLSSMCTEPHPAAREAAERFLATNPGDPATYAEVADLGEGAFESLRDRGWRLSRTGHGLARVVVMPHVTRNVLQAFLADFDEVR